MIYNMTSSKEIIAKVFADLNLKEDSHRVEDMKEWTGEALEKIGATQQLYRKTQVITVVNNRAPLPADLYNLVQAGFSFFNGDYWIPMRSATGTFDTWGFENAAATNLDEEPIINDNSLTELVEMLYRMYDADIDYEAAIVFLNANPDVRSILQQLINKHAYSVGTSSELKTTVEPVYRISSGYILTNSTVGYIKIAYDAIPVDDDGFLLIPDHISYREAISKYIIMKLHYADYIAGRIHPNIYTGMVTEWNYYCKQAYGQAMMPSVDSMESIKNQWNRLVPELGEHGRFMTGVGEEQVIYNQHR